VAAPCSERFDWLFFRRITLWHGRLACESNCLTEVVVRGHVGIGTNSLTAPLHVTGAGSNTLRVENSAASATAATFRARGTGSDAVMARALTGLGGYFLGEGSSGKGVLGAANARAGVTSGVAGVSSSTSGRGVRGEASADSGLTYGGWFISMSPSGYGVYGIANADSGTNYGVYGATNSPAGYAGYFSGNVHVTGRLSKGGGSFKIDHPLDPENKYLYHSFVESPDMMNIYNGNVILDGDGEAVVTMPEWFETLNRDFRYQLTCMGGFAPVYIAEKIYENRFKISGGQPGLEVSWQVTGIRQDPFAEANRIPVEEDKPAEERGKYLHHAAYGLPQEMGIDYQRDRPFFEGIAAEPDQSAQNAPSPGNSQATRDGGAR